ncbi:MAG: hypothetical protein ACK515_27465, partial [bacterium]
MTAMRGMPFDARQRRLALGFTAILHALALACIFLLHVQAPRHAPERPPLEVVMITPPAPLPEPGRPPEPPRVALPPPVARPAPP